ncbi:MAG: phage tail protein [Phycisphaerales bacterium]|nr:phage tail protein [Phycisphaerales bacterium]
MGFEPFIGEIKMVGFNYAPRGWAKCDGQLLPISQNQALFSLLGTQYGGDGETTFGLPDLRGRVPLHAGNGPGLTNRPIGQKAGEESTTLSLAHLPPHNHPVTIQTSSAEGDSALPGSNALAKSSNGGYTTQATDTTLGSVSSANAGSGQAHQNMQPYQAVNFVIALTGIFPSPN